MDYYESFVELLFKMKEIIFSIKPNIVSIPAIKFILPEFGYCNIRKKEMDKKIKLTG